MFFSFLLNNFITAAFPNSFTGSPKLLPEDKKSWKEAVKLRLESEEIVESSFGLEGEIISPLKTPKTLFSSVSSASVDSDFFDR
jgi:hypothetical protein